ncbi:hypothetical protein [Leptolyngbya sp. FACHB-261]|uniref:hypothetical protein n=1 Tax=Leptolyngbya sp. FACHB-261 TaxID=2692806 RepID=UPI001682A1A6|nr:hypothetical protein [Leptolyngbya sp. FACHB-261]MBD2100662.1 hypothetical protein [Leptolyngbya sp. FACHB-261]
MSRQKLSQFALFSVAAVVVAIGGCRSSQSSQASTPATVDSSAQSQSDPESADRESTANTLAISAASPVAQAQQSESSATTQPHNTTPTVSRDGRVELANGRISFVPPPGFTAMTSEEIAFKFPRGNPPQYVYANERQSVSIAVTFSQSRVSPTELPKLKAAMEPLLERVIPGLQWRTRELVDINNTRWVRLEATSRAIDTDVRNDMYFTSFDGKMLGFNFNSTVEMDQAARADLLKSRDSIVVNQ